MTTGNKIMWKRGEILRSNFSSFPQYFQYISIFRSQITYSFVKCGCLIYLFSSVLQIWYVEIRIIRSILESPLDFEITRVDCTSIYLKTSKLPNYKLTTDFPSYAYPYSKIVVGTWLPLTVVGPLWPYLWLSSLWLQIAIEFSHWFDFL